MNVRHTLNPISVIFILILFSPLSQASESNGYAKSRLKYSWDVAVEPRGCVPSSLTLTLDHRSDYTLRRYPLNLSSVACQIKLSDGDVNSSNVFRKRVFLFAVILFGENNWAKTKHYVSSEIDKTVSEILVNWAARRRGQSQNTVTEWLQGMLRGLEDSWGEVCRG